MLGISADWGRWLEIVVAKLPDILSGSITFKNVFSIRVLQWLVILVVYKIKGRNELHKKDSKDS